MPTRMHADEVMVDEALVSRLLATQLPDCAALPLVRVEPWGTDHGIWRLGEELVMRLPRIGWAARQAALEATWLPRLAPHLPVAVPTPVALGEPGEGYPFPWAVHRWVPGAGAGPATITDPMQFARQLAEFVRGLQQVPTAGAPAARGRARHLRSFDAEARSAIRSAAEDVDVAAALAVWEEALDAEPHAGPSVWVHGDIEGNCLVGDGGLCGVVDWGSACAGDPAVDVQVVWSPLFTAESAPVFLSALAVDAATLARSRGAAVQQACAALPYYRHTYPLIVERSRHKLQRLGIEVRAVA